MKKLSLASWWNEWRSTLLTCALFALIGCVGFWSYHHRIESAISLALVGGGASIYLGLLNHWLHRDKMMQELFTMFNARYDKLNDDLLSIRDGKFIGGEGAEERVIVDYLNLCAEEYFWYRRGRIDQEVWEAWKAGMHAWLQVERIRVITKQEAAEQESYYGLFRVIGMKQPVKVSRT